MKFGESCLKQSNKLTYTHKTIVNIYIAYKLGASSSHHNDPTLKNCLFGAVTLIKNADIEKYGYSGYGIGFDRRLSSSAHIDNKKKDILVLGERTNIRIRTYFNCRKNVFD